LACDGLCRALAGAGIGVRALAADRKAATMTQATVATEVHEALDVHRGFATQVAFDLVVAVDGFADLQDFRIRELMHATIGRDTDLLGDFLCEFRAGPGNVTEREYGGLRGREVYASDSCHACSPCFQLPSGKWFSSFDTATKAAA